MKKTVKRAVALVLAVLQLVLLCGCKALDEMRKNQAFRDANGNIQWNGETYKALPHCDYLQPELDYMEVVYVTQPDVPVLLSPFFAETYLTHSVDQQFLVTDLAEPTYYCRESQHAALSARLMEPFVPELVCYSYDVFNEDTQEYESCYYTLTQAQVDVIKLVVEQVAPMTVGEGWTLERDYDIWLEECSQDMLLRRNSMDIVISGNTYYLFLHAGEQTVVFTVPDGCKAEFDGIVSAYIQSMGLPDDENRREELCA